MATGSSVGAPTASLRGRTVEMQSLKFDEIVAGIAGRDPRYHRDAYQFMREALEHTQKAIVEDQPRDSRHVSVAQLLDGLREYALQQYGPMAAMVLSEWGVRSCEDFGEIVFLMVEHNLLSLTERDRREDFKAGYSFYEAFERPFLPESKRRTTHTKSL